MLPRLITYSTPKDVYDLLDVLCKEKLITVVAPSKNAPIWRISTLPSELAKHLVFGVDENRQVQTYLLPDFTQMRYGQTKKMRVRFLVASGGRSVTAAELKGLIDRGLPLPALFHNESLATALCSVNANPHRFNLLGVLTPECSIMRQALICPMTTPDQEVFECGALGLYMSSHQNSVPVDLSDQAFDAQSSPSKSTLLSKQIILNLALQQLIQVNIQQRIAKRDRFLLQYSSQPAATQESMYCLFQAVAEEMKEYEQSLMRGQQHLQDLLKRLAEDRSQRSPMFKAVYTMCLDGIAQQLSWVQQSAKPLPAAPSMQSNAAVAPAVVAAAPASAAAAAAISAPATPVRVSGTPATLFALLDSRAAAAATPTATTSSPAVASRMDKGMPRH